MRCSMAARSSFLRLVGTGSQGRLHRFRASAPRLHGLEIARNLHAQRALTDLEFMQILHTSSEFSVERLRGTELSRSCTPAGDRYCRKANQIQLRHAAAESPRRQDQHLAQTAAVQDALQTCGWACSGPLQSEVLLMAGLRWDRSRHCAGFGADCHG